MSSFPWAEESLPRTAVAAAASGAGRIARVQAPFVALALTAAHACVVLLATGQADLGEAYRSLLEWDAQWYASIVDGGYQFDPAQLHPTYLCNCAFFPGLPILAAPLTWLGIPSWLALPLVAQLCCWGFWNYLLLLMRRWAVPPRAQAATVLVLALYPWSFFLQVGYSESPFLFFLTGYLYWSERRGRLGCLLAALHGVGMTATRLVGVAAVVWPLFRAWRGVSPGRVPVPLFGWRPAAVAGAAVLGVALFYGYLGFRFGRPDLYHVIQHTGMSVRPDHLVFLRWDAYLPRYTNGVVCPLILLGGLWLARREWRLPNSPCGARSRTWALLAVAGLLFYLVMAGMINRQLCSLPRIGYPAVVLLLLAWANQAPRRGAGVAPPRCFARLLLVGAVSLGCLALQAHFVQRFIHRRWVAGEGVPARDTSPHLASRPSVFRCGLSDAGHAGIRDRLLAPS